MAAHGRCAALAALLLMCLAGANANAITCSYCWGGWRLSCSVNSGPFYCLFRGNNYNIQDCSAYTRARAGTYCTRYGDRQHPCPNFLRFPIQGTWRQMNLKQIFNYGYCPSSDPNIYWECNNRQVMCDPGRKSLGDDSDRFNVTRVGPPAGGPTAKTAFLLPAGRPATDSAQLQRCAACKP